MLRWCIAGLFAAVAIAWCGAKIHASGPAPIGLVPLGLGIALAVALGTLAANLRVEGAKRLILGTVAVALVAVLAQHAWLYREYRRQWRQAREASPHVALFRSKEFGADKPWTPAEYFARELTPRQAVLWSIDAVVLVSASAGAMTIGQRKRTQVGLASDAEP